MDEVVRRGLVRFEPGAGGEHKLVRGFTPSLTYSAHALFHRGLDRAVREFLAHERAAIQAGMPGLAGGDRLQGLEGQPMPERADPDSGVVTESKTERKLKRPQLYKVLFHNDNYTTRDFVVAVLREVFHKSESDAVAIMLHVHNTGIGVAGVYTYDVARTKIELVEALAREHEFPLRLTMEPEEI